MFDYDNVVPFPLKKKPSWGGWLRTTPRHVVLHYSEFGKLAPYKRPPAKTWVEHMTRFINMHGLTTCVIVDDQNAVIAGHNVLMKARKNGAWNVRAYVFPLKRPGDKCALAEAYKIINQPSGGKK